MSQRRAVVRLPIALVIAAASSLGACSVYRTVSPSPFPTELNFTSVLAKAPMTDTARVAGVAGKVVAVGLLNQTPPCFGLTSDAAKESQRIVLRLTATEVSGTCNTFAAGAFDYNVGVSGVAPGTYDVEVVHRVLFKDGRAEEHTVGAKRVEVK